MAARQLSARPETYGLPEPVAGDRCPPSCHPRLYRPAAVAAQILLALAGRPAILSGQRFQLLDPAQIPVVTGLSPPPSPSPRLAHGPWPSSATTAPAWAACPAGLCRAGG
jgi:hypothetical protein